MSSASVGFLASVTDFQLHTWSGQHQLERFLHPQKFEQPSNGDGFVTEVLDQNLISKIFCGEVGAVRSLRFRVTDRCLGPEAAGSGHSSKLKTFSIHCWSTNSPAKPKLKNYEVDLRDCGPMVLVALIKIKNEMDSSLTFCRSYREGICSSCEMKIDGCNDLACLTKIDDARDATTITPLPHVYVIKDLVLDMMNFYN